MKIKRAEPEVEEQSATVALPVEPKQGKNWPPRCARCKRWAGVPPLTHHGLLCDNCKRETTA